MDLMVIVAMIAAISAIVAPVLTEVISRYNERKLKQLELFFTEKAKAYSNFIEVTSQLPGICGYEDLRRLSLAMNQAILYSSNDTAQKLALYVKFLKDNDTSDAASVAYADAMSAPKHELQEYQK